MPIVIDLLSLLTNPIGIKDFEVITSKHMIWMPYAQCVISRDWRRK